MPMVGAGRSDVCDCTTCQLRRLVEEQGRMISDLNGEVGRLRRGMDGLLEMIRAAKRAEVPAFWERAGK